MQKKFYEIASEKIEAIEAVKDVLYAIERSYDYDYEYETDENGNCTWNPLKDENGDYIRKLSDNRKNKILDEICEFLAKKYL